MSFFSYAWNWVSDGANWHGSDSIPYQLVAHLGYSGLPLLIATLIAVPAGVAIGHRGGPAANVVINIANAWRSIPTLGLLILLAVYVGVSTTAWLVPLVVLAIPPILINSCEGVSEVDPDVRDAAKGVGMTTWQQIIRVEVPIAVPLIMLGLRTSAIFVVATATIAAYIGFGGLGRFIFDGLASNQYGPVAGGALLVVILAVLVLILFTGLTWLATPAGLRKRAKTE
jgi:osmoprotectant transport system permease protein